MDFCWKDIEFLSDVRLTLPPDRPRCGFYDELCPEDNTGNHKMAQKTNVRQKSDSIHRMAAI